jgi:hypothetical protein
MSQQTAGGKTYKKTDEKILVGKASRCVYITSRGAKHVKMNGEYVNIRDIAKKLKGGAPQPVMDPFLRDVDNLDPETKARILKLLENPTARKVTEIIKTLVSATKTFKINNDHAYYQNIIQTAESDLDTIMRFNPTNERMKKLAHGLINDAKYIEQHGITDNDIEQQRNKIKGKSNEEIVALGLQIIDRQSGGKKQRGGDLGEILLFIIAAPIGIPFLLVVGIWEGFGRLVSYAFNREPSYEHSEPIPIPKAKPMQQAIPPPAYSVPSRVANPVYLPPPPSQYYAPQSSPSLSPSMSPSIVPKQPTYNTKGYDPNNPFGFGGKNKTQKNKK